MQDPPQQSSKLKVLLGITGGIAAYKSPDLVRRLAERGCEVRTVLTSSAKHFVSPMSLQAVSGHKARWDLMDADAEASMGHIELARWADVILVAPATADVLAKAAHGIADDLLTTLLLASESPVFFAPAMNRVMWSHGATQSNVATLEARGVAMLGPGVGEQACGDVGAGRMLEPAEIADQVVARFNRKKHLADINVLITAGPTLEDIDPVRFIGNRSSGKMGFALAKAAFEAGATVTVIHGPTSSKPAAGITSVCVRSAAQMHEAVMAQVHSVDIFIAAAAVADYRPRTVHEAKLKKEGQDSLTLELVKNPDILMDVCRLQEKPFCVGFAAETNDVSAHAKDKMKRKGADMIVANRVGGPRGGFDDDANAVTVFWSNESEEFELVNKSILAVRLLRLIHKVFTQTRTSA